MKRELQKLFKSVQNGNDVRGAAIATEKEALTLTPALAAWIARAFARFLAEENGREPQELKIGIGHDSRLTAKELKAAACTGLSGCHVYDCGLITTPAMFQSVVLPESDFDGSIMLTASHLPFNRNGLKFFTKSGALSHAELDRILEIACALAEAALEEIGIAYPESVSGGDGAASSAAAERVKSSLDKETAGKDLLSNLPLPSAVCGGEVIPFDMKGLYCSRMKALIRESVKAADYEHPLSGLHIVVDSGNGASGFFAADILGELGADTSGSQFLEPDGTFPNHIPNPENAAAMQSIRDAVLASKADLGVIFDCDGDRGAVVFADGTEVNRNTLIALLSAIVAEEAPGSTIVTDSITSDELGVFLEKDLGLKHLRFKRGYKNVIDKGIELNAEGERCELAIETSGHGAFRENHFSDDGAYIAVKIICRMAKLRAEGKRLEDLIADLRQPAEAREVRFSILREDFAAYGKQVLEAFRSWCESEEGLQVIEPNYEGVRASFRLEGKTGWVLLRMSLHDPVMPMNLESSVQGGCDAVWEKLQPFLSQWDGLSR